MKHLRLHPGDRVEMVRMEDDPDPVPPQTRGTVRWVRRVTAEWIQVDVEWDNGRTLMLSVPPDQFKKVTDES